MKHNILLPFVVAMFGLFAAIDRSHSQGTAFTYQGRLTDNGNPATGNYDLRFAVYDANTVGNPVFMFTQSTVLPVSQTLLAPPFERQTNDLGEELDAV